MARNGRDNMLFQDELGVVLLPEEIEEMSAWEIEERGVHVLDDDMFR